MIKRLLLSVLLAAATATAQQRVAVTTSTNGLLLFPTNFFAVNSNALNASVSGTNMNGTFAGTFNGTFIGTHTGSGVGLTNLTAQSNNIVDIGNPNTVFTFPLIGGNGVQRLQVQGGGTSLINFNPNSVTLTVNGSVASSFFGSGSGLSNLTYPSFVVTNTGSNYFLNLGFSAAGTNAFPTNSDVSFSRRALTSLANGNNAGVPVGTNVFVEVSGPTTNFTINGIDAGGAQRDGKWIWIVNRTGWPMSIANDSGIEPVAANRIYSGGNITFTGNPQIALLNYHGNSQHWLLWTLGTPQGPFTNVALWPLTAGGKVLGVTNTATTNNAFSITDAGALAAGGSPWFVSNNVNVARLGVGVVDTDHTVQAKLTVVDTSSPQAKFVGWSPDGTLADGSIWLGTNTSYHGHLWYGANGNTTLSFDNNYDNSGAKTQFRLRTGGTAVNALTLLGSGNATVAGTFQATNGAISTSNSYPITSWSALGNCGCITWMSNATLYLICTNSINSNATTNRLGGL